MRGVRNTDRKIRKFITIADDDLWDMIDQIMTTPEYKSSFNKVINEALFIGLPLLHDKLFGAVRLEENIKSQVTDSGSATELDCFEEIIRLLKELILNVTINKSLLSSLFNLKNLELNGAKIPVKNFSKGAYSSTPDYMEEFEINGLRKIGNE